MANGACQHAGSNMPRSGGSYPRRLASVPQVAAYLGVSSRTIWSWIAARKLETIRVGVGTVRIDLNALEAQLDANTIPAMER